MKWYNSFGQRKTLLATSVCFIICGFLLIFLRTIIFQSFLVLKPGSIIYKYWKRLPIDIATDYYIFNWTNPEDLYNQSVKAKFEEIGPYRFWQKEHKINITFNDNGTVTYRQIKHWYFDEKYSKGNLSQEFTTINNVAVTASYITRKWNYYARKGIFLTIGSILGKIPSTHSVNELLFDGYREPLINVVANIPYFSYLNIPHWDRFGWTYKRNGSFEFDGIFNMGTGINSTIGEVYYWNYLKTTPYFEDSCAKVSGSAGQLFTQNLDKNKKLSMFSPDIRRTTDLKFETEERVNGILGYKYSMDKEILDNGTLYPQNSCYCNGECVPSGTVNVSSTRHGFPLFVSLPHFYLADPYYNDRIEGLRPDAKKHNFEAVIEPTTGIPLKVDAKIQVNILVQPISGVPVLENVSKFFFPVLWVRQTYEVTGFLVVLIMLLANLTLILFIGGTVMIIIGFSIFFFIINNHCKNTIQSSTNRIDFFEELTPLQKRINDKK